MADRTGRKDLVRTEAGKVPFPDKTTIQWAKKCLVGFTMKETKAEDIVEFLQSKGYVKSRVCRLSSAAWILDPVSVEEKQNILNEKKEWLNSCFNNIGKWEEYDVNGRRRVWVNIFGVPLHAWCDQMFRRIGNRLGRVLEIDVSTLSKSDLSKGKILIETPTFNRICKKFEFKIWT